MKLNLAALGSRIGNFFDRQTVDKIARETKFVQRESPVDGSIFLRSLVWGCIEQPRATLKHWAQVCLDLGVTITAQGIDERINAYSLAFLQKMFSQAMAQFKNNIPLPLAILQQFTAINLIDSSIKALPDNLLLEYPGSGGTGPRASLKMQLVFDFLHGNLAQFAVRAGNEPDQKYRSYLAVVTKGSLNLLDLGYFCLQSFQKIMDLQAYFLTRYLHNTGLCTTAGEPLDLLVTLQQAGSASVDLNLLLGFKKRLPVRLLALKAPQEVADRRRQKARENARRKGRTLSPRYLALLDWTIFVTNVPAEMLSITQVVVLYRVRWQIELVFKLWKSYCGLNRIAGLRKERVLTELYAKMIGIVLTHFLIAPLRMPGGAPTNREISPVQVRQIFSRFARELNRVLGKLANFVKVLSEMHEHIRRFGFKEKRRKKPNVCQLLALVSTVFDLENNCELKYNLQSVF